ncbi:hypothetical protein Pmar_PMAR007379 [Perkinsus marinus ATCC 50983]|uniref:TTF-type domain-containing protein n=1 Tax=Perkinsus marinus (strain ATCC 50983 / TXsc) TaxID=423536 RepID=C5K664_PERM5|nr:hypothetical protein Pmar_PMAR007379 [Perkinsus marinus ATCC 50983]EER20094.1 hypothetical protein Pmar_PMAR007379 [Perkinsus marinus ATCC 50983]|eukprot:XP_002788298.1 hypothetical protein Pmar_PMAR007379 [Perkinsus marinus ATCC 50983]
MDRFLKRARTGTAYPEDISVTEDDGRVVVKGKNFLANDQNRSFLPAWQDKYPWLEYSTQKDAVYCYYCRHFGAPTAAKPSPFFDDPHGFSNWKKAVQRYDEHSASEYHQNSTKGYFEWSRMKEKGQSVVS